MKIQYIQPLTTIGEVGTWGSVMSISVPYNPDTTKEITPRAPTKTA